MCYTRAPGQELDYFPRRFFLICLDTQQIQYLLPSRNVNSLEDFISRDPAAWLKEAWWLWTNLARPVLDVQHVQAYNPRSQATPAAIERLPNELLDEILDHLSEDKRDVLSLGLSSAFLWNLVVHRVQSEYARYSGLLAGKRMLYLGFEDHQLLSTFGIAPTQESQLVHSVLLAITNTPQALHTTAVQSQFTKSVGQEWAEALAAAKGWNTVPLAVWERVEHDLTPTIYPQDEVWVLRNLTTCEFVRSDKLLPALQRETTGEVRKADDESSKVTKATKVKAFFKQRAAAFTHRKQTKHKSPGSTSPSGPESTPLTFAQIFLILICYSRETPYDEQCFGFQEGRWAGHAFDIVTWDAHTSETKPHEWADVSELAVDDVANLRHLVEQLELARGSGIGRSKKIPRDVWQHIWEDRMMFHDWEGLDTQSALGASRWSQKPVQRGLLVSFQAKSGQSAHR